MITIIEDTVLLVPYAIKVRFDVDILCGPEEFQYREGNKIKNDIPICKCPEDITLSESLFNAA